MTNELSQFSLTHRKYSWWAFNVLPCLPGFAFIFQETRVGIGFFLICILFFAMDPVIRGVVRSYEFARHFSLSIFFFYLGGAGLSSIQSILTVPYLLLGGLILIIYFGRRTKKFERDIMGIDYSEVEKE